MSEGRRFVIGDCLGRGGFGEVYAAQMRQPGGLETQVAIKVLHRELAPGTDAVRRLHDEARLLARLAHPTIVRALDLTVLDGRVALVMEYVDGADLDVCVRAQPPLSMRGCLQVVSQVAAALAVAHRATDAQGAPLGLVHRDVKPTNIRVGRHGQVKLLDFGIAYTQDAHREARTESDLVVGSMQYMAPERFASREASPAWDVFGLGAVLYESLAGRRFLPDGLREAARIAVRAERYDAHLAGCLDELGTTAPVEVTDLLGALLAYRGTERPSAADVEQRCDALADEVGGDSLKRWCRAFSWVVPRGVEGPLRGRTLTEGSLEIPRDEPTAEAPPPGLLPERVEEHTTFVPGGPEPEPATDEATFVPATPQRAAPVLRNLLADAPTEELPAWSEPPTEESLVTPRPSGPGRASRSPRVMWPYFAGGVLLSFSLALFLVGSAALLLYLRTAPAP